MNGLDNFFGLLILFGFLAYLLRRLWFRLGRRKRLLAKYRDEQIVDRIIKKTIWVGETKEQLLDSLGNPIDIDEKVMKSSKKEIFKYFQNGKARFRLRVTLEDGEVTGWDEKL